MAKTRPSASRPTRAGAGGDPKSKDSSIQQVAREVWELTVGYAKQEISDPVKGLGRYLAWGSLSMLLIGIGMVLLAIGALRALQTETGSTFTGSLTWAPYGIVLAGAIVVLGIVGALITKGKK